MQGCDRDIQIRILIIFLHVLHHLAYILGILLRRLPLAPDTAAGLADQSVEELHGFLRTHAFIDPAFKGGQLHVFPLFHALHHSSHQLKQQTFLDAGENVLARKVGSDHLVYPAADILIFPRPHGVYDLLLLLYPVLIVDLSVPDVLIPHHAVILKLFPILRNLPRRTVGVIDPLKSLPETAAGGEQALADPLLRK